MKDLELRLATALDEVSERGPMARGASNKERGQTSPRRPGAAHRAGIEDATLHARRIVPLALCAACLLAAQPAGRLPIAPKLQKPTRARLLRQLPAMTAAAPSEEGVVFRANGRFSYSDTMGTNCYGDAGVWTATGTVVEGDCVYDAAVGYDTDRNQARLEKATWSFRWEVDLVGDGLVVFRERGSRRCWAGKASQDADCPAFLEIVPGAPDRELLEKVRERLATTDWSAPPLLFDGTPAKNPRKATEIFFGPRGEGLARGVAETLRDLVGDAKVAPWPGQGLDADVAVVVGAAKAEEKKAP